MGFNHFFHQKIEIIEFHPKWFWSWSESVMIIRSESVEPHYREADTLSLAGDKPAARFALNNRNEDHFICFTDLLRLFPS